MENTINIVIQIEISGPDLETSIETHQLQIPESHLKHISSVGIGDKTKYLFDKARKEFEAQN